MKPWNSMSETSRQYLRVLTMIQNAEQLELNKNNYLEYLNLLLYVEEFQHKLNLREFDMFGEQVIRIDDEKQPWLFKIHVEGLMEERPSVVINDLVDVMDTKTRVSYILKVTDVQERDIIASAGAGFCHEYREDNLYDIKFLLNNFPFRCCHYALELMHLFKLASYAFPTRILAHGELDGNRHWYNSVIANNPEQKQAVLNIINKSSLGAPYILYGPPGTGKTATLVEAVCQVWGNNLSKRILICTPSNTAADVITKQLIAYIPKIDLHRMYSFSKDVFTIDEDILDCCNCVDEEIIMFPASNLPKIIITTLCTSTRLLFYGFRATEFSYIFIDEAGQATEPESIIPFTLLSSTSLEQVGRLHGQVILAGDPKQLGPVNMSKIAKIVLEKSMLERLMTCAPYKKDKYNKYNPRYITKLVRNYRSHPSIIYIPNKLFYNNELKACYIESVRMAEGWRGLPNPKFPIIFEGVSGTESKDHHSPSAYNTAELRKVLHYVQLLVDSKLGDSIVKEEHIGCVTPFTAQKVKLKRLLRDNGFENIEVGTVQLFQGKEKEIIILSTVRSNTFLHKDRYHIGFLSHPKRLNVALTRAKSMLIIVGNSAALQVDENWWRFLWHCIQNNAYRGDGRQYVEEPTPTHRTHRKVSRGAKNRGNRKSSSQDKKLAAKQDCIAPSVESNDVNLHGCDVWNLNAPVNNVTSVEEQLADQFCNLNTSNAVNDETNAIYKESDDSESAERNNTNCIIL